MPLIDRDDSFLAVIDVQPSFYRDRPDVDPDTFDRFVATVAWVTGVAAALDLPIVVTEEDSARNGPTAEEVRRWLPERAPVLAKPIFDLSSVDSIRTVVNGLRRGTAVLVGMETDVCVAQSALGLAARGLRVAAVTDALYAPEDAHQHGLERLRGAGVELVSAKGLFYEWIQTLEEARRFTLERPKLSNPSFAL